ncbi:hypothetical protein Tco_1019651 [Tanacetum coccineum]|uniref:Uncharacterized protein n=1 Tax=Tanacetum coccineum TaxID=301880 RepID=A0ABQ5FXY6_9ASTR
MLTKNAGGLQAKRQKGSDGLEAKRSGLEAKRSGLEAKRSGLENEASASPSLCNPEIQQLTIKLGDEYGFVIRRFIIRTSLTGFPAQSVRSSNADALDSLYLLVSLYRTPQSRLPH